MSLRFSNKSKRMQKRFQLINISINHRIGNIVLNRPEKRNALSPELIEELNLAFNSFKDNNNVKIIVLKAAGEVFCAGADLEYLKKMQDFTYEENLTDSLALSKLFEVIYTYPKIVIAQVEGHALAGGAGLALVCDFIYSVPKAKFGFTEESVEEFFAGLEGELKDIKKLKESDSFSLGAAKEDKGEDTGDSSEQVSEAEMTAGSLSLGGLVGCRGKEIKEILEQFSEKILAALREIYDFVCDLEEEGMTREEILQKMKSEKPELIDNLNKFYGLAREEGWLYKIKQQLTTLS